MKKIIASFLSFLILLTVIPAPALAAENGVSDHEELIALACEVFPEYASAIRGENNSTYVLPHSGSISNVVFSETRNVSDTRSLSISQMSSGQVIIVQNDTTAFNIYNTNSSTSDITTVGVSGTASFKVTSNAGSGTFTLSNVQFVIYYTGSDYFSNNGTASAVNGARIGNTQISTTYMNYPLTFTASVNQLVTFEVCFSNNQLVASIY